MTSGKEKEKAKSSVSSRKMLSRKSKRRCESKAWQDKFKFIYPNFTLQQPSEGFQVDSEKEKKFQRVGAPGKMTSRKSKQRENGWQDEHYSSFDFKIRLDPNCSADIKERAYEFEIQLKKSEGFYVDSESRSFDVAGFYRVYPFYDWDTTQIQDQKAILNHCCEVAVIRHNQRTDDHLIFEKLVSANMLRDGFPIYFITLNAYPEDKKQLSRAYRTRVKYIRYRGVIDITQAIINIHCFKPVAPT